MTSNEAKDFIIGRILSEARREGVSVTEIERKMLYFSEVNPPPSVPDQLQVSAAFDKEKPKNPQEYDCRSDEYETEMAALLSAGRQNDEREAPENAAKWAEATQAIQREDHYLGVIIMEAGMSSGRSALPPGKKALGILIVVAGLVLIALLVFSLTR